jgi:ATP synthase F1 complex assembly factor 1
MKLLKDPSFRRLFFRPAIPSRFQQRRWAKVHDILFNDVRFHATHTTQDRILEKYRDKLGRKAREYVVSRGCF